MTSIRECTARAYVMTLPREEVARILRKAVDCWITASDPIGLEETLREDLVVALIHGRISRTEPKGC